MAAANAAAAKINPPGPPQMDQEFQARRAWVGHRASMAS